MDQDTGTTKKKQVLFSIGSYVDRNTRVINKISAAKFFNTLTHDKPSVSSAKSRPESLDLTDAALPRYRTLPNPKIKSIAEKFAAQNGQTNNNNNNNDHNSNNSNNIESNNDDNNSNEENNEEEVRETRRKELIVDKPTCPPNMPNDVCEAASTRNGSIIDKPMHPPKLFHRSQSLEPEQLRNTGRVALTISSYEGEPRTPTRLDFLPSRRRLSTSSKASSSTDGGGAATPTPTPVDAEPPSQIGTMLQDELLATLKKSNLREKNDDASVTQEPDEANVAQGDGEVRSRASEAVNEIQNGCVRELATVLDKKITFCVNPENGETDSC